MTTIEKYTQAGDAGFGVMLDAVGLILAALCTPAIEQSHEPTALRWTNIFRFELV